MKSLLELPSKEFVDFIGTVTDYQQTGRLTCTFWWNGNPCFGSVNVQPYHIFLKIQPMDSNDDIGLGYGVSVEKMFERTELMSENKVSVSVIFNGKVFKHWIVLPPNRNKLEDIKETIDECYEAIKVNIEDPERLKVLQVVQDQWLDNVIKGNADANGEFVPSNKQVTDRLKNESTD